jgi:hypothetical protein
MTTAQDHFNTARTLRDRIISGKSNELPVQAWAAVARECAIANNKMWAELGNRVHGRAQHVWFSNLDRLWWAAKAQVETFGRAA